MPLDTSGMLLGLKNLSPINLDGVGTGSMERERLKLMREQFENQKQQQARAEELARLEEGGRMAREKMQGEQRQAEQAAEAAALVTKNKQAAFQQFSELNGKGDIEGARALVPYMSSLGMSVDLLDEEAGLPRYQIEMDPNAVRNVEEPAAAAPGIGTTEEAFGRALGASAHFDRTGTPLRDPETPDNVIDMRAIQKQTLQRLDPRNLAQAYPEGPTRDSAMVTADTVRGMGLPASKSAEMFDKLRGGPDAQARAEIEAGAQQSRFQQTQEVAATNRDQKFIKFGQGAADKSFQRQKVGDMISSIRIAGQIEKLLTNDDDLDDAQVANLVMELSHVKGAQSDKDVARALGLSSASTIDQIVEFLTSRVKGGFGPEQINSLIGYAKTMSESDKKVVFGWLDTVDEEIANPDTEANVGRGWDSFRKTVVPRSLREERDALRKGVQGAKTGGEPKPFNMEEDAAQGAVTIPETSRIAREHNNPGNLKFADQAGATKGEPADDGGHWAKFDSTDAGLEALRAQIEKDADRGADRDLTIREFVSKYAPPGSNDTEVYIKQATKELRAEEGDKLSEVDVYDVLRFVAKKESGTELPGQYSKPPEESDPAFAKPGNGTPPKASSGADRIRELLKKGGY